MAIYPTYRLRFRSPLHVGERGVGLEAARAHVSADTLFSALCSMWRELYGLDALEKELLGGFNERSGNGAPFFLTSAFPFAGETRFFPRPLVKLPAIDGKALRRAQFVSENVFAQIVNGEQMEPDGDHSVNGGAVWVGAKEKKRLGRWIDDAEGNVVLWKQSVSPRVTLDRITAASVIWHFGSLVFAEGCGLWFAARFNPAYGAEWRRRFEAALRLLGDSGLGGERGAGHGLFDLEKVEEESLPDADESHHFVTLSPCCPKDGAQTAALMADGENVAYELAPRRGWVTSPEAGNLRRKMVWMMAEGSVLSKTADDHPGRLVDVRPEVCPHDVWRYGYGFPVGVRLR